MNGNATVIILGGGQGKRLFPLTSYRSKPAVPIGGKYRLVDIPISNSINSGLRRIFVLTQFNSTSLHRHIHRTYPYEYFHQTSVELLAAEQTPASTDWFQGTADAVRKHLPHYHLNLTDTVLILSGDHLYRMDYRDIIKFHQDSDADLTIATVPVPKRLVNHFGILQIQANGRVSAFREKPSPAEKITSFEVPAGIRSAFGIRAKGVRYLASMGVYVFKPKVLIDLLAGNETDFGREVIPKAIENNKAFGYVFSGYWRDIGTIRAFYEASIELTLPHPPFSFYNPDGVIFTRARFLPPSKVLGNARLRQTLIGEGGMIDESQIESSVIGVRSVIRKGSVIRKSVIMGNDYYESDASRGLGVGKNCRIENAILDKNVHVGDGVVISNPARVHEKDGENYFIRDGIVIIPKNVKIPSGTKI